MTKHFDNAALEILKKQEKALKLCHSPALELCNRMSSVLARTSTLEIPAVSCPQSVISAMEQYRSTIAPYCPDFSEISQLAETLQRQLPLTKIPPSFSAAIDLPYLHTQEMENILRLTASLHAAMQPIIDTLSPLYRAFDQTRFDSALVDAFGYLQDIAQTSPHEVEQIFTKTSLEPFAETSASEEKPSFLKKIKNELAAMPLDKKIVLLFKFAGFLFSMINLSASNISVQFTNHTEKVIIRDTIQETSDTDFSFRCSPEEQNEAEKRELISQIEKLKQQIETLEKLVHETRTK